MIQVNFYDIYKVNDLFKRYAKPISDPAVRDAMGEILLKKIQARFKGHMNPDGRQWPWTKAARIRSGAFKTKMGKTRGSDATKWHSGGATYWASGKLANSIEMIKMGLERRVGTSYVGEMQTNFSSGAWSSMPLAALLEARWPGRQIIGYAKSDVTDMLKVLGSSFDKIKPDNSPSKGRK